jgi:hypothetical protein
MDNSMVHKAQSYSNYKTSKDDTRASEIKIVFFKN